MFRLGTFIKVRKLNNKHTLVPEDINQCQNRYHVHWAQGQCNFVLFNGRPLHQLMVYHSASD